MFYERIRYFRHSASVKIAGIFFLSFSLFLATAFTVSYFQVSSSLENSSHDVILSKWREINAILESGGPSGLKKYLDDENRRLENSSFMIRVLSDENPIFQKVSSQQKPFDFDKGLKTKSLQKDGWTRLEAIEEEDRFEIYSAMSGNGMRLQIGQSSEYRLDVLESLSDTFLWIGGIFCVLSGALGFWYARKVLLPVRTLTATVRGITAGNFNLRAALRTTDIEFAELGSIFDIMVDKVQRLISGMKSSVENVAHDLRTPLSKISMIAERAILKGDNEQRLTALQECAEYSSEISEFISQVLEISEVEAGTLTLHKSSVDLKVLVASVVEVYEFVALEKEITLEISGDSCTVFVDEKRFKQAIGNLIDNAIKFSGEASKVQIHIQRLQGKFAVAVKDSGVGISQNDLPHIFERLFRGDKSRSSKGAGLGLAVVKSIITAHDGVVDVQSYEGKGSTFTITVPA